MRAEVVMLTFALCACGRSGFGQIDAGPDNGSASDSGVDADANDFEVPGVVQISAMGFHLCARTGTGVVRCWGRNNVGQVGGGFVSPQAPLTAVQGLPPIMDIAVGEFTTFAVDRDGGLWAWGENAGGQLGLGTVATPQLTPAKVTIEPVIDVAASETATCATARSGVVYCWGENTCGQLGQAGADAMAPQLVPSVTNSRTMAVDDIMACSIDETGIFRCWGDELRPCGSIVAPSPVASIANARDVAGSCHETRCAIDANGAAWCWGTEINGSLGDGTPDTNRTNPVPVQTISGVTGIGLGYDHTCAMTEQNQVWCWGSNAAGMLGAGMGVGPAHSPLLVPAFSDGSRTLDQIELGCGHSCVRTGHDVYCWGGNMYGAILGAASDPVYLPTQLAL
jgi:alpha-tubulin suppressor-like RCC1 family protein